MSESESYIERIQRLASHNQELRDQLEQMLQRFAGMDMQSQHFKEALLRYSPEMKGRKNRKELRNRARQLRTVSILFVAVKGFDRLCQMANTGPLGDQLNVLNLSLYDIAFMYNVVKLKSVEIGRAHA